MEEKEWLTVPGFPGYEVNGKQEIRSLKRRKEIMLKVIGPGKVVTLFDEEKERHCISWARFYYCAMNRIDPRKLERKGIFISIRNGEFKVETLRERIRSIKEMPSYKDAQLTLLQIEKRYEECRRFMDMVMEYYRTGDGKKLTLFLFGMKDELNSYMINSLKQCVPETRDEIFGESVDIILRTIDRRNRIVDNPYRFMYTTVRNLVKRIRKRNAVERDLNENILYDKTYLNTI
ncbi:hypothetical protein [Phocaeicola plebeius]|uniref:hypothetical protein n=1 Tax=Phocaeicola plebeius TaxID=310297 RepID=UPI003A9350C6